MSEFRDPAIKLFGKTIILGPNLDGDAHLATDGVDCESTISDKNFPCSKQGENRANEKVSAGGQSIYTKQDEPSSSSGLEESKTLECPSNIDNPKTVSSDGRETSSSQDLSKKQNNQSDQTSSSHSQDELCPPKKPDKILPCPRCNSMDTKFCYFNNYNVNQPRHFCKNCQRYWTAGGTMRNVPVGAGRHKNKTSSSSSISQHRGHLVTFEPPSGLIHHTLPESASSMLKLAEKPPDNGKGNSGCKGENGGKVIAQGLPPQVVCFSGNSWPYTWNPIPVPSGFPMPFYPPPPPPPYLGCNSPGTWNLQWLPTSPVCPDQSVSTLNPDSPSLGKHSRDGDVLRPPKNNEEPTVEKRSESSRFVIPKTMRIDDPTEAAKSSIWGTLGVKNDSKVGSSNVTGGFYRGFEQPKDHITGYEPDNHQSAEGLALALQANPAAFSRSLSFHENA